METLDANNRQSGISALIHREKVDRIDTDRIYTSPHSMATSTLVSPTSIPSYSNNPPPPPYSQEFRRTSDNKTVTPPPLQTASLHRQSLPSIHEALNSAPKSNPYASPVSGSLPPTHQQFPYPQGNNVPRSYPSEPISFASQLAPQQPRQPSPLQPIHSQAGPFGRPETVPTSFPEVRRGSATAAAPPTSHYGGRPYEPTRYEQDPRGPERLSNGYTHHPPQQQQGSYTYPPQAPQGHLQSIPDPRHQPRDPRDQRDPRDPRDPRDQIPMDAWKGRDEEKQKIHPGFRQGLKRHLDVWDFENNLAQINTASSTLQEWSGHYNAIAQEQQRHIPDRMPTVESCDEMLSHNTKIQHALQRMKETIHQQEYAVAADMHQRNHGAKGPSDYDDDISMYGDEHKGQGFGGSESKKRRGRAAPPGRCHSCNRAETPEWRRGPDGARTLCNACGLHYAKLTRKNGIKPGQPNTPSSLRLKSLDDHSPRP